MPTKHDACQTPFASLPGSALLRIFQLLCDSCPPETPGTCWLEPVCSQWRVLACHVKGLRVLFQGHRRQRVDSFCTWLRRHAPQVVALAITIFAFGDVLAVLADTATGAAATGNPLPLQRLILTEMYLMQPRVCQDALQPLLRALPHLQHLHLSLWSDYYEAELTSEQVGEAVVSALAPLQHATSLTSLVLDGPYSSGGMELPEGPHAQILAHLPCSLRKFSWHLKFEGPEELVFSGLPALTHLKLSGTRDPIPANAFNALPKLRKLELQHVLVSDEGALACKQQLVALGLLKLDHAPEGTPTPWLTQLTKLTSLDVYNDRDGTATSEQLLQLAPGLKALQVELPAERDPTTGKELWPWAMSSPWVLRHYPGLTGLQRLSLAVPDTCAAPQELCALTQLKQLKIFWSRYTWTACVKHPLSWAQAVAKLVNLEVLSVPAEFTACSPPWLNTLPRLVVLDVHGITPEADVAAAAVYISQRLVPQPSSSSGGCGGSSSSSSTGAHLHTEQVRVVCCSWYKLHKAVAAAFPVLPPNRHLFRGSWQELQQCGVELWPAPVAARLQQLV